MKKVITHIMMPHKALGSLVLFIWTFLFSTLVFAQNDSNITLGDVGNNISKSGIGIANAINVAALVGGAGFFVVGLYLLASERQRSQKGIGGPLIMLVIGVGLLTWQFFAQTVNNTTLGTSAKETFLNE